jgi:hypothetical protein
LVRPGLQAVVVPSGFRATVQPRRWITTWWWKVQYRPQSLTLVLPAREQPGPQEAGQAAGTGQQIHRLADDRLLQRLAGQGGRGAGPSVTGVVPAGGQRPGMDLGGQPGQPGQVHARPGGGDQDLVGGVDAVLRQLAGPVARCASASAALVQAGMVLIWGHLPPEWAHELVNRHH